MAPTAPTNAGSSSDVEVLLTGFGPFSHFGENPSWLAVAPLHDTYHECPPCPVTGNARRIHIQCIQVPVVYSSVLDVIPRIHGNEPRLTPPEAQPWFDPRGAQDGSQGDGHSFPHGYSKLKHLPKGGEARFRGYDVVLHVGVGRPGAMRIETRARKSGYRLRDRLDQFAPLTGTDSAGGSAAESEAIKYEAERMNGEPAAPSKPQPSLNGSCATLQAQASATPEMPPHRAPSRHDHTDAPPRGFPESGYPSKEGFLDEEKPNVDTSALLDHLNEVMTALARGAASSALWVSDTQSKDGQKGRQYVQPSDDAGLFLCEYIYYASLAESKRATQHTRQRSRDSQNKVLFMHCPPIGDHLSTAECTHLIHEVALYLARDMARLE